MVSMIVSMVGRPLNDGIDGEAMVSNSTIK